jgi:hypothetical protein
LVRTSGEPSSDIIIFNLSSLIAVPRSERSRAPGQKNADESMAVPKGTDPRTLRLFPCKTALSRDRGQGPSSASWTPGAPNGRASGGSHGPVVAVLVPAMKRANRKPEGRVTTDAQCPLRPSRERGTRGRQAQGFARDHVFP